MAERIDFINAVMVRMEALADFKVTSGYGGVHLGAAPHDDAEKFPYLVVNLQASPGPEYNTGTDQVDIWPVLFNVYATDAETAAGAIESIEADLEGTALAPASGSALATHVGSSLVDLDPDRDAEGEEIWHATVLVEFTMQRTLT